MSCNPYAPNFAATCGGQLLPAGHPLFNPYWPDGFNDLPTLTPAVFAAFSLPDDAPEALPVTRHEDELATLVLVVDVPVEFSAQMARTSAPVPEPAGAALLSVALLAALWRARR
jgi:hypothetical protein